MTTSSMIASFFLLFSTGIPIVSFIIAVCRRLEERRSLQEYEDRYQRQRHREDCAFAHGTDAYAAGLPCEPPANLTDYARDAWMTGWLHAYRKNARLLSSPGSRP